MTFNTYPYTIYFPPYAISRDSDNKVVIDINESTRLVFTPEKAHVFAQAIVDVTNEASYEND